MGLKGFAARLRKRVGERVCCFLQVKANSVELPISAVYAGTGNDHVILLKDAVLIATTMKRKKGKVVSCRAVFCGQAILVKKRETGVAPKYLVTVTITPELFEEGKIAIVPSKDLVESPSRQSSAIYVE